MGAILLLYFTTISNNNNSENHANVGKKATKAQVMAILEDNCRGGGLDFRQKKSRPDMGVSESATNRKT